MPPLLVPFSAFVSFSFLLVAAFSSLLFQNPYLFAPSYCGLPFPWSSPCLLWFCLCFGHFPTGACCGSVCPLDISPLGPVVVLSVLWTFPHWGLLWFCLCFGHFPTWACCVSVCALDISPLGPVVFLCALDIYHWGLSVLRTFPIGGPLCA